jgi:hypothetical protein
MMEAHAHVIKASKCRTSSLATAGAVVRAR